jgi:oligopeptide/dipeptide ABC transporter ATP-binding protein
VKPVSDTLIRASNLKKLFEVRRSPVDFLFGRRREYIRAVDGIDLELARGEVTSLVGESGSGKTTTGRLLLLLEKPTEGEVWFDGVRIDTLAKDDLRKLRRRMQMVFQDPYGSLNPRLNIFQIVCEPLQVNGEPADKGVVSSALSLAGLRPPEAYFERYPYELSGGQRQRVAIARAMVLGPEFVVADEPVSMLDVSLRMQVLNVLKEFNEKKGTSILLITHDLTVAAQISHRIAVMYLGKIVEEGPTGEVLRSPRHPYTQALVSVVPKVSLRPSEKIILKGEIPSPKNIPPGCRFHPRCPYAQALCQREEPDLADLGSSKVACHYASSLTENRLQTS